MKKIIALAVASAFVVPAAMAEVTVYGSLRTGIEVARQERVAGDFDSFRLTDQNSRLGFKGSDKLDNGLTVLWQTESRIRAGSKNIDGTLRVTGTVDLDRVRDFTRSLPRVLPIRLEARGAVTEVSARQP